MIPFEKWLESACSVVVWGDLLLAFGLYDGIGAVDIRVYAGRFTLYFSDFNVEKRLSNLRTFQLNFLAPNRTVH